MSREADRRSQSMLAAMEEFSLNAANDGIDGDSESEDANTFDADYENEELAVVEDDDDENSDDEATHNFVPTVLPNVMEDEEKYDETDIQASNLYSSNEASGFIRKDIVSPTGSSGVAAIQISNWGKLSPSKNLLVDDDYDESENNDASDGEIEDDDDDDDVFATRRRRISARSTGSQRSGSSGRMRRSGVVVAPSGSKENAGRGAGNRLGVSTVSPTSWSLTSSPVRMSRRKSGSTSSHSTRSSLISSIRPNRFASKLKPGLNDLEPVAFNDGNRMSTRGLGTFDHDPSSSVAAAAAAVVAAVAQAGGVARVVQFGQGDFALVQLSRLSSSIAASDHDLVTLAPVNRKGYPFGEGKTEAQRCGPHRYVLCKVIQVHFDEDERYYTVRRLDTEKEQRADRGLDWMEPLPTDDPFALESAYRASKRCRRSVLENGEDRFKNDQGTPFHRLCVWLRTYKEGTVQPTYSLVKLIIANFLRGTDDKFALSFHFSAINFLVGCSFIYLLLEVVVLAFLKAEHDQTAAIIQFSVWFILLLELVLEYFLRPANYSELITSDRAFSPSTARHVNLFHLTCELLGLILFIPQIPCAFAKEYCGLRTQFSPINAALLSIKSSEGWKSAGGRFYLGLTYLRAFGLVRHWKQMWINHTFDDQNDKDTSIFRRLFLVEKPKGPIQSIISIRKGKKQKVDHDLSNSHDEDEDLCADAKGIESKNDHDRQLKKAANIGTALMLVNSHRSLFVLIFLVTVFPVIYTVSIQNPVSKNIFDLLQSNNAIANTTNDCDYLRKSVTAWLLTVVDIHQDSIGAGDKLSIQWAQILPIRCEWQLPDGVITNCRQSEFADVFPACAMWNFTQPSNPKDASPEYFATILGRRPGELTEYIDTKTAPAFFNYSFDIDKEIGQHEFYIRAIFNESETVKLVFQALLGLLLSMLALVLVGLTAMREDATSLVLEPLQRMLKIVVRYAENPLSTPASTSKFHGDERSEQLGNFETEQLINAISKIADLLRKCWGVAGAGIISSNLARTKSGKTVVFNPTIPGKRVYALFGFVGINHFDQQLRRLDKDVMKLINDVARVVHDEVYRWALGDSGQCNKNLGGAFLMVFRIGDFNEVRDRKKRATDVVFNSQVKKVNKVRQRGVNASLQRRRFGNRQYDTAGDGTLQLASLPGIQGFADRAVLGFLKSFAGLHRDQNMQKWEKDFRLCAGIGTFTIDVIFGMDAGWAVEGAVGSEYKIDATYLSPHVNMASRMMSASKQYGVTLLMSQAVEELLSKPARSVMRHLDTVYVKGSNVSQRIYTYDSRFAGVDFFLFERSPEQADSDADAYTPSIWEMDQDLKSMRQHVSDEFRELFTKGLDQYFEGNWTAAMQTLQSADYMMLKAVVEEGYINYDYGEVDENDLLNMSKTSYEIERVRNEYGDGACKCLVQYMQRRDGVPPSDWHGVRKLDSK